MTLLWISLAWFALSLAAGFVLGPWFKRRMTP